MTKKEYALYVKQDLESYLEAYNKIGLRNSSVYHCGNYNYNSANLDQMMPPSYNDISSTAGHSNDIKVPLGASLVDTTASIITQFEPELKGEVISNDCRTYFKVAELEDFLSTVIDKNEIYRKARVVCRNSLVFSKSALWYNQLTDETFVLNPYTYAILNNEKENPKWGIVRFKYFSVNWLKDWGLESQLKSRYHNDLGNLRFICISLLYSIIDKTIYIYHENDLIKEVRFPALKMPIDELFYKDPLEGGRSIGIIDESYASQDLATYLTNCVKDHAEDAFQPTILTKNSTGFKHISINTNTGQVYNVINSNGSEDSAPIEVFSPNFTNTQFTEVAEWVKSSQYQLTGVNISTASGQLQQGVSSAEMVYSLNDLQNQRLQLFQQNWLLLFKHHLETYILNKDPDTVILDTNDLTWGELQSYWQNFSFKFDISDSSRFKRNKEVVIGMLMESGMITKREAAELTVNNDIKSIRRIIRKTRRLIHGMIKSALNNEEVPLYPWTPLAALSKIILEVASDLQSLNQLDDDIAQKLMRLYERSEAQQIKIGMKEGPSINDAPPQSSVDQLVGSLAWKI